MFPFSLVKNDVGVGDNRSGVSGGVSLLPPEKIKKEYLRKLLTCYRKYVIINL